MSMIEKKARTILHPKRVSQGLGCGLKFVPISISEPRLSSELSSERNNTRICHR